MTFDDYRVAVARTESIIPSFSVHNGVTVNSRGLHATMGLMTEAGELIDRYKRNLFYGAEDKANLIEEIGDITWYFATMCNAYGENFYSYSVEAPINLPDLHGAKDVVVKANSLYAAMQIFNAISSVSIDFSYHMFHGNQVLMLRMRLAMTTVMEYVNLLCKTNDIKIEDVFDRNIEKLKARYPAKFDTDNAVNRDLLKERNALGAS